MARVRVLLLLVVIAWLAPAAAEAGVRALTLDHAAVLRAAQDHLAEAATAAERKKRAKGERRDKAGSEEFERLHPRAAAGTAQGGQFATSEGKRRAESDAKKNKRKKDKTRGRRSGFARDMQSAGGVRPAAAFIGDSALARALLSARGTEARRLVKLITARDGRSHAAGNTFADGVRAEQWAGRVLLPELRARWGDRLIVQDDGDPRVHASLAMLARLSPRSVDTLLAGGARLWLGARPMSQLDPRFGWMGELDGARGHDDEEFDDVGGIAFGLTVLVNAAASGYATSVVLHELGHAMDTIQAFRDPTMRSIHAQLLSEGRLDPYFAQPGEAGVEEFVAELFMLHALNPEALVSQWGQRAEDYAKERWG